MKHWWIVSLIVGGIVLFSFPEPQTNFLYYLLTAGFFMVLTIILYKKLK